MYLLRINDASGAPGSITPVHSHPGSEAFFVLAGERSIRGAHGAMLVNPGQPEAGNGAGFAMQVTSTGSKNLQALVMFVVDAAKPLSSPAKLPQFPRRPVHQSARMFRSLMISPYLRASSAMSAANWAGVNGDGSAPMAAI